MGSDVHRGRNSSSAEGAVFVDRNRHRDKKPHSTHCGWRREFPHNGIGRAAGKA